MRCYYLGAACLAALVLCGCQTLQTLTGAASTASTVAASPVTQTAVVDASSALDTAAQALAAFDRAATVYAKLPICGGPGVGVACSNPAMVKTIKADAGAARVAIEKAQAGTASASAALATVNALSADFANL